ncbi:oxoglutarate-dependent flavonoid 7-O-demethylase 1-like [Lotus japonicus]|uniref:oxoglutarate-dependent flavonoid 7-O-demethylase 1-like n=1 Tax=Lotus japonicus TaxID=34305 RepID=UPI00258792D0|nr:oxoglutarate-dependent flavonoid 7-O-demethylase 1-like [Lotus japonicus]
MEATPLAVPFVQVLAEEGLTRVPERYVRPQYDRPILSTTVPLRQVPIIDLSKLLSKNFKGPELERLHHACKEWGFFQLINHGVSTSLLENVKRGVREFFNLPMEEKMKFQQRQGETEGYGQLLVFSEDQKLEWGDMLYMLTLPPEMRKPHSLPKYHLPCRNYLEAYYAEMKKVNMQILELMANALSIDTKEMTALFAAGTQKTKFNYYPPCPQPELVIGIKPHSDLGGLTILLQANEVEGLQIKKDGQWIPIKPLPNAFIINIGDMLEVITNGIYRSIEHRATVNSVMERISIATFNNPITESTLGPLPSLITPTTPAVFRTINFAEYLRGYFSREVFGKSYLARKLGTCCGKAASSQIYTSIIYVFISTLYFYLTLLLVPVSALFCDFVYQGLMLLMLVSALGHPMIGAANVKFGFCYTTAISPLVFKLKGISILLVGTLL